MECQVFDVSLNIVETIYYIHKMAEPTLESIFGANSTQDADWLRISKSDLATNTGLTPSANNTGESLFVAILKQSGITLTSENQENNEEQGVTVILSETPDFITRGETLYQRQVYTVNLDSEFDTSLLVINPNNY